MRFSLGAWNKCNQPDYKSHKISYTCPTYRISGESVTTIRKTKAKEQEQI